MEINEKIEEELERKLEPPQRRLDSLARLLEGSSSCVAVACENQQFYISANEFTEESRIDNQKITFINNVMLYFKSIANGGPKIEANQYRDFLVMPAKGK